MNVEQEERKGYINAAGVILGTGVGVGVTCIAAHWTKDNNLYFGIGILSGIAFTMTFVLFFLRKKQ